MGSIRPLPKKGAHLPRADASWGIARGRGQDSDKQAHGGKGAAAAKKKNLFFFPPDFSWRKVGAGVARSCTAQEMPVHLLWLKDSLDLAPGAPRSRTQQARGSPGRGA